MLKQYSQEEIVLLEGDEVVKNHLIKNGRLTQNVFNRFVKDLKQRYTGVRVEGKGSKKTKYLLGEKRKELAEREDNRIFNGGGQLPMNYEEGFPIIILEHLMKGNVVEPRTATQLLRDFGFITNEMYMASKARYDEGVLQSEVEKLKENGVIDDNTEVVVHDYINNEIDRLIGHLIGFIRKLEKAKIIIHNKYTIGVYKDKYGRKQYEKLSPITVDRIALMRQNLQETDEFKHLTLTDIYRFHNKKEVQEYWKKHDELLYKIKNEFGQQLHLLRTFDAHSLFLQAGGNPIMKWLKKKQNRGAIDLYKSDEVKYYIENREKFHDARDEYIVNLAQNRQDKQQREHEEKTRALIEEVGGKKKRIIIEFDDTNWIRLQKLKCLGMYVEAYESLQDNYGYKFD